MERMRGAGIFFDGKTSGRHAVAVELAPAALQVRADAGHLLARWPYGELQQLSAPEGLLRLGRINSPVLARVEIRDPTLAAAIDDRAHSVDRTDVTERRSRNKVIAWSLAATVSLVVMAVFGVPAIAERLAPLLPDSVEQRLGDAVDVQFREMLDTRNEGPAFECGSAPAEQSGRAALASLVDRLEQTAKLTVPLNVAVVRRAEPNAVALPGGRIYLFEGLIRRAQTADEFAGVLAHEIGHVAHRDGTRSVLQAAGLSLLFGMLLGDFVGGGAVVLAARAILQSSHGREVERAADAFAVDLMTRGGGDVRALAAILTRITDLHKPSVQILLDHPDTKERVAAINAAPSSGPTQPLLDAAEWAALKRICSSGS